MPRRPPPFLPSAAALLLAAGLALVLASGAHAQTAGTSKAATAEAATAEAVTAEEPAPAPGPVRSGVDRVRQRLRGGRPPTYVIVLPAPAPPQQQAFPAAPAERPGYAPAPYIPARAPAAPGQSAQTIVRDDLLPGRAVVGPPAAEAPAPADASLPRPAGVSVPSRLLPPPELPPSAYGSVREVERALFEGGLFRAVGINFEFGKSRLLGGAGALVDPVGDVLRRYPEVRLEVAGHTDSIGGDAANQRLSERRARTIVDYLVSRWGISPARLVPAGYGEAQPLVTNSNPTGRTLNRRVEFRVLPAE